MALRTANPTGRRLTLTLELQEQICRAVRAGACMNAAAAAHGVSVYALYEWMRRGRGESKRRGGTIFINFVKAIEQAQAQGRMLAEIKVMRDDPKWYLSHHPDYRKDWGEAGHEEDHRDNGLAADLVTLLRQALIGQIPSGATAPNPQELPAIEIEANPPSVDDLRAQLLQPNGKPNRN